MGRDDVNNAQRQHWEYQQKRAKANRLSHPGSADKIIRTARDNLKQPNR